jgi:hypothetical protein
LKTLYLAGLKAEIDRVLSLPGPPSELVPELLEEALGRCSEPAQTILRTHATFRVTESGSLIISVPDAHRIDLNKRIAGLRCHWRNVINRKHVAVYLEWKQ